MPLWMEISLDGSSKTLVNERIIGEQKDQTLKEKNKEFYNAHEEDELEEPKEHEFSKTQQKKQGQKLHWALMRFKNGQLKRIEVQNVQVNEPKFETDKRDDLLERENITGKK